MKIALASAKVIDKDITFNLHSMISAIQECSGHADLILFGESVLQGFDSLCWNYEIDKDMAVEVTDEPIQQMRNAAKENHIAVSFGFIERAGDVLYSSQIFISADGRIVNLFHRVSVGWKEFRKTDKHYREGAHFERSFYNGKTFAIGLCGDLWTDGRPEEMKALNADIVLWPVWCDYKADEWNTSIKHEYAQQAALCGKNVLLVNPFCADPKVTDSAAGGVAYFQNGAIVGEMAAGQSGYFVVEV
ncbi:MAG: carbon-nitrogen hydrolase family protein [Eubacteriales bacterium]